MAAKKATTRRTTRSKAETKEAFAELSGQVAASESLDRVSNEAARAERARVGAAVGGLTVDTVVKRTASLELDLTRAIGGVREQLIAETQQLEDLRSAIKFAEEELKSLHNLEIASTSLENLIQEFKDKEKVLEEEIQAKRVAWLEEQTKHEKQVATRDQELATARKREQEQYSYDQQIARRKEEDTFRATLEAQKKANALEQERLQKDWAQREESLQKQETEIVELRTKVAGFDELLKKEVDKAEKIVASSVKRDLEHKHLLETKDKEAEIALLKSKLEAAEVDKTKMAVAITQLQDKLDAAQKQVAEVATRAIDGASGNLAMQKMQETISATSQGGNGGRKS